VRLEVIATESSRILLASTPNLLLEVSVVEVLSGEAH
jgi:hypothetical protein